MAAPSSSTLGSIRLISWNIKGIQHPIKRSRVFAHLRSLGPQIIFLQETHLCTNEQAKLGKNWISHIFCSKYDDRSRGKAILVHKEFPFVPTSILADENGRYIIVTGKIFGLQIILANVYGPNWDNPQFFTNFISKLPDLHTHHLILGGDFNCILQSDLDRSRSKPASSNTVSKAAKVLHSFMESYNLTDPWRKSNPTMRQNSFFSPVHQSYSRINYFLLNKECLQYVTNCQYHSIVISDHCPVQLDLSLPNSVMPRRTWQLDPLLLTSNNFIQFINNQIDNFLDINQTPCMSYITNLGVPKGLLEGPNNLLLIV